MVQTMAQMYQPVENGGGNIDQKGGKILQEPVTMPKKGETDLRGLVGGKRLGKFFWIGSKS